MSKMYSLLIAFFVIGGVLTGCGSVQNEDQSVTAIEEVKQEVTVSVTLSKNNGEEVLSEKEVTVEEGATLLKLMQNNFEIDAEKGFINSIEGIAGNEQEKMAWMFTINGEMAMVGANEYEVKQGDTIVFDYHSWE